MLRDDPMIFQRCGTWRRFSQDPGTACTNMTLGLSDPHPPGDPSDPSDPSKGRKPNTDQSQPASPDEKRMSFARPPSSRSARFESVMPPISTDHTATIHAVTSPSHNSLADVCFCATCSNNRLHDRLASSPPSQNAMQGQQYHHQYGPRQPAQRPGHAPSQRRGGIGKDPMVISRRRAWNSNVGLV
jgi:hypothetical protein